MNSILDCRKIEAGFGIHPSSWWERLARVIGEVLGEAGSSPWWVISNAIPHPRSGQGADRSRPRALSQTRKRRNKGFPGGSLRLSRRKTMLTGVNPRSIIAQKSLMPAMKICSGGMVSYMPLPD
jgi:hypothetical protein